MSRQEVATVSCQNDDRVHTHIHSMTHQINFFNCLEWPTQNIVCPEVGISDWSGFQIVTLSTFALIHSRVAED